MSTTTFKITGMHCSSCSMLVTMNLEDLPGVASVDCDHATGRTVVEYDSALSTIDELRSAITAAGYDVDTIG